jgi:ABC-2 type transport system permease protein
MSTSAEGFLTAIATAFYAHMRLERTPLTERHLRPQPIATVTTERRVLFNPTLSGPIFMIPGLLGLIPMFVTVLATTLVVVRERDAGTLEQLLVTPVSATEVVLGKVLPFMVVGMLAVLLIMGVGWLFFGLTPAGNIALLLAVTPAFLLICLSIGLLVSSIAHSSADAVERSILIMVPQLFLSDAIFPLSLMTWPFRAIGELVPLTHFLRITRGVYLKGQGVADLWGETLILLGFLLFFLVRARQAIKQQMS